VSELVKGNDSRSSQQVTDSGQGKGKADQNNVLQIVGIPIVDFFERFHLCGDFGFFDGTNVGERFKLKSHVSNKSAFSRKIILWPVRI
jgi:hypothetical protein